MAHECEVKVAVACENLTHSSCPGCVVCDYFEPAAAAVPRNRGHDSISVELAMAARGGRGQSRNPRTTPPEVVQAALERDLITIAYRNGGVLLHDEVVVEQRNLRASAVA